MVQARQFRPCLGMFRVERQNVPKQPLSLLRAFGKPGQPKPRFRAGRFDPGGGAQQAGCFIQVSLFGQAPGFFHRDLGILSGICVPKLL